MTIKQRQHLLAYLGYYVGDIDGDWAALSREACKAFQRSYNDSTDKNITVDGYGGPETDKALRYAVANDLFKTEPEVVGSKNETTTGTFWDEIEYFTREEFRCQCYKQVARYGGPYCDGFPVEPDETLLLVLDEIRRRAGVPIRIVDAGGSGIRCQQHNAHVGGVANSEHKYGRAADLHPDGMTPAKLYAIAVEVCAEMIPGRGGIGLYDWGVHVDVGKYSRWNG